MSSIVTKEDVDKARELLTKSNKAREVAKSAYDEALANEKVKQGLITTLKGELGESANKSLVEVKSAHVIQETKVNSLLSIKDNIKEISDSIISDKDKLSEIEQAIKALESKASSDDKLLIIANSNVVQLENQTPEDLRDIEKLQSEIKSLTQQITSLNDGLTSARKNKEDQKSAFDKAEATDKSIASQLADIEKQDDAAQLAWKKALSESVFEDLNHFETVSYTHLRAHET